MCQKIGYTFDLTRQLPQIEALARSRDVRLLVVDPLVAGLPAGEINAHRDQDVRSVLAPLAALSEELRLATLTTGHFSKAATSALLGAGGSIGFVGAARSILVFGPDPNDRKGVHGSERVLAHAKCNVGRLQHARRVTVEEEVVDPFGRAWSSRAVLGDVGGVSADDLVRVEQRVEREAPRAMGERPEGRTLDRINNDGNYAG